MKTIQLSKAKTIQFVEIDNPLTKKELELVEKFWKKYSKTKPFLFNGNILAIENISFENEVATLHWFKSNYAHYLIRNNKDISVQKCKILYCSVILETINKNIVFGKMSHTTSSGGKILLPGGNVELINGVLDFEICKHNAVRELKEEIGFNLLFTDLELWRVKSKGNNGDVGLFFKSKEKYTEKSVQSSFNELALSKENTELTEIYFVNKAEDFSEEEQKHFVDYVGIVFKNLKDK